MDTIVFHGEEIEIIPQEYLTCDWCDKESWDVVYYTIRPLGDDGIPLCFHCAADAGCL